MESAPVILLYSPFPSMETARAACRALVEGKLVACCNLLPAGESHYLWEGTYTLASEIILIAKTTAERVVEAMSMLALQHPYECPAILRFEALSTPAFARWVADSTC